MGGQACKEPQNCQISTNKACIAQCVRSDTHSHNTGLLTFAFCGLCRNPTFRKLFGEWIAELKQGGAAAGSFEGAQGSPEEKEGKGAGQGETTSGSAEGQQGLGAAGAPEGAGQGQPGEGGTKPGVVRSQGKAAGGGGPGGNGSTIMWVIVAGLVVAVGLALVPYFAPGQAGADSAS